MKKNLFRSLMGLMLLSAFLFTSCSKDDDKTSADKLHGKWTFTKVEIKEAYQGDVDSYTETPGPNTYIEFKSGGTFTAFTDDLYEGTWKLDGNSLTVTGIDLGQSSTDAFTVQELTASTLKLHHKESLDANNYFEATLYLKK